MISEIFIRIRDAVFGINANQARFDILQSKLDAISTSVADLSSAVGNFKKSKDAESTAQISSSSTACQITTSNPSEALLKNTGEVKKLAIALEKDIYQKCCELEIPTKFAFLIHDPTMLVHYGDVWNAFGASNFTIVLTKYFAADDKGNEKLGVTDFFNQVNSKGYKIKHISEVLNTGTIFEYVVTNHVISGSCVDIKSESEEDKFRKLINRILISQGKEPAWNFEVDLETFLPLQIGTKQIRYMYGADISDGWSLAKWNEIYDIFLCHGVNDQREIQKRFRGKTFIMGYPRYDRFFSEEIDLTEIQREFGISKSKKTLLWMPTLGGDYSSIPLFAEPLATLSLKYNIIVRPHPISFVQEKDFINLLEKFNFNIDRNALRDMNELYSIADVVLADNGGTPFSAIFLGALVVFLHTPSDLGSDSNETCYIANSSVMELKKHLPVVSHRQIITLEKMLESRDFYIDNTREIERLFQVYFDSPRGGGAQRVADFFKHL